MAGEATLALDTILSNIPFIHTDASTLVIGGATALVISMGIALLYGGMRGMAEKKRDRDIISNSSDKDLNEYMRNHNRKIFKGAMDRQYGGKK